ncbi:shikimate 5-dehydrogenase [Thermoanaerobacterium thermosaccharolyticum DSM 571]|jgi:shikimate dehydrogenase|uniref:Shikimate dehydrogenase (NADP(+)) n=1 Tax=Thermoanaerobacterium thermosaccharolyticum (strain ATCC 7956 / DSM 571 / NCIMB 9385 / NCA 3814 / NCTC 13789 / WDCM 00135 / 2032) TaxID=580327 RepID=D9TQ89_THETC|nr:shikimate dehydrogenase [Thermoanaerobacterium thermosaccharolyticum]ADL68790.1 shikimate 5-dehydrogenase [Thermoanaerobacterium thermosaccharolyticum DSM 571]MCP2239340.1 shikimate dehydrogenase [Thermoanaerobacterium thermosaccharolyticum]
MHVNAKTDIYGIIGHPIGHSLSPFIHNAAFESVNLNSVYVSFDVHEENLKDAILGIKALGIKGINVTVPHKENVMKYLDYISDEAKLIGAVNTIKNNNGILEGYNTDVTGFTESLKEHDIVVEGKNAVILGAGGAARAVAVGLSLTGVKSIMIANRSKEKARNLSNYIKNNLGINCIDVTYDDLNQLEEIDILVNVTSVGMFPDINLSPVDESIAVKAKFVYDIIYNPEKTQLLSYAEKHSIRNLNGFDMLINQANHSFKIWTGMNFNKNIILNTLKKKDFVK